MTISFIYSPLITQILSKISSRKKYTMATAKPNNYVPIFVEGDDEYVYVQELGVGFQAQAQLVRHTQSGEYRVRKISKIGEKAEQVEESLGQNEIDTLRFLQDAERQETEDWYQTVFLPAAEHQYRAKSAARLRGQAWYGIVFPEDEDHSFEPVQDEMQLFRDFMTREVRPEANRLRQQAVQEEAEAQGYNVSHNIVTLYSNSRLALPTNAETSPEDTEFMPVIYLSYCNGGDLNRFGKYSRDSPTPASIVLRYVAQISHALSFMYDHGVVHADLEDRNIFIDFSIETNEPRFFLGDFGMAHGVDPEHTDYYNGDLRYLLTKLTILQSQNVVDNAIVEPLVRELTRMVENRTGMTGLPDLSVFVTLVNQAVVDFPVTQDDLLRIPGPLETTPTFYGSVQACSVADVVGTYRIGTVALDSTGALESLENISEEVYYPEYFPVLK